jgi:hypothetical protein
MLAGGGRRRTNAQRKGDYNPMEMYPGELPPIIPTKPQNNNNNNNNNNVRRSSPYGEMDKEEVTASKYFFTTVVIVFGIWILTITIILSLLTANVRSDINKLDCKFDNLTEIVDGFATCCEDLPTNCTCPEVVVATCWDADTNTPELLNSTEPEDIHTLYIVCTPGNTTLDGFSDWEYGDYAQFLNGTWFQNKATGSIGLPHVTITANWTCSLTPEVLQSEINIWALGEDWFWMHVEGVFFENVTVGGNCTIDSTALPTAFQMNTSLVPSYSSPDISFRDSFGAQASDGNRAGVGIFTDAWSIYQDADSEAPFFGPVPFFGPNSPSNNVTIGFYSFDITYTPNPLPTPNSP